MKVKCLTTGGLADITRVMVEKGLLQEVSRGRSRYGNKPKITFNDIRGY